MAKLLTLGCVALGVLTTAACGGGGNPNQPEPDTKTASVAVSGPATQMEAGRTLQLTATAKNQAGSTLSGKSFAWSSSSDAVATVSAAGLVSAVAPGQATIAAEAEGKKGAMVLTITAVPVASVSVAPGTAQLDVGQTQQLTATAKDAAGTVLPGRAMAWKSSNVGVATVSTAGLVSAAGAGEATITAESEGKSGPAQITVRVPIAARVSVSPLFATVDAGQSVTLAASALTADGRTIANPGVTWTSLATGVASVNPSGAVGGVAAGQARVVARVNDAADTATVAVLGAKSLVSTAFAGGAIRHDAKPGAVVSVPVTLDLSKVSSTGDLGSVELELTYDANVLQYQSATLGLTGSAESHLAEPGRFRFAFASANPQGKAKLTLVTLSFRVAANAAVGATSGLSAVYVVKPTNTSFQTYEMPIPVSGRLRVVAP